MGLWEQLTQYLWNYIVMNASMGFGFMCFNLAAWGVFWNDDDGVFGNQCF